MNKLKRLKELYHMKVVPYQVNIFITAFLAAILCAGTLIHLIKGDSLYSVIRLSNFQLVASITVVFGILTFLPVIVVKLTHIILLLSLSVSYFYSQYNNPYAFLFWMLMCILSYRYGFLKKYTLIKIILLCVFLLGCIEVSLFKEDSSTFGSGIQIVLLLFGFITLIYIAYKKELDKILFYEKKSKALMTKVQQEKEQLQAQIVQQKAQINTEEQKLKLMKKQLEEVIAREQPCNLERFDLTSREREILELLVMTKRTNKEIAEVLGVKEDTVKKHLHNIYDKIGIDDRYELIDLCKNNFRTIKS